jgi:hypothetical protein
MKKYLLLVVLYSLMTLACGLASFPLALPTKEAVHLQATSTLDPTVAKVLTLISTVSNPPRGYTRVHLVPGDGNLMDQLRAEVQKAAAKGQKPFVVFDASW